jgi:hypothetical protein
LILLHYFVESVFFFTLHLIVHLFFFNALSNQRKIKLFNLYFRLGVLPHKIFYLLQWLASKKLSKTVTGQHAKLLLLH